MGLQKAIVHGGPATPKITHTASLLKALNQRKGMTLVKESKVRNLASGRHAEEPFMGNLSTA